MMIIMNFRLSIGAAVGGSVLVFNVARCTTQHAPYATLDIYTFLSVL